MIDWIDWIVVGVIFLPLVVALVTQRHREGVVSAACAPRYSSLDVVAVCAAYALTNGVVGTYEESEWYAWIPLFLAIELPIVFLAAHLQFTRWSVITRSYERLLERLALGPHRSARFAEKP